MILKEYMQHRGVNANALTDAEAKLIGVDTSKKGWAKLNAAVSVPDELAKAINQGAKRDDLKLLAASLLAHKKQNRRNISALSVEQIAELSATNLNPGHAHEAMDRCHVLLCTLNDHLLQHPYVESDADVRREVEAANAALSRAYQLIGGFPHKDAK